VPCNLQYAKKLRRMGLAKLDFWQPIFGCSLQVLGSNPCQNALFSVVYSFLPSQMGRPKNMQTLSGRLQQ